MMTMPADAAVSQTPSDMPRQRWGQVLLLGFAVYLVASMARLLGGGLLHLGLAYWLVGAEAISDLTEVYSRHPAETQAILSFASLSLLGNLFAVPIGLLFLRTLVPRSGLPVREYLGLRWPKARQGLGWGLLILAVDFGFLFLVARFDLPWTGDDSYEAIGGFPLFLPLLVLSLVVLTPVFEELLFRGFLLEGLRQSRLGEVGAILMTASLWAVIHPGGPVRWLSLALYGALLAIARLRTGSTWLAVVIHGISNLAAVIAIVWNA